MADDTGSLALRPQELEAVYAISRVIGQVMGIEDALDQITNLTRPVFIFDNVILYLLDDQESGLEPAYARIVGRGRSAEADLSWGEMAANQAFSQGEKYIHHERFGDQTDRLNSRFFLALPLQVSGKLAGALVFIRFGGPAFEPDHIHLAEFIADNIVQLLAQERLVERIAQLEADRRMAQLQDDFIAMVSHELHTPLGFIKGYATTLLRKDAEWDDQTRRDFLAIIDEESDRLNELIENLLDSSRLQSGNLAMEAREVELDPLMQDVLQRNHQRYPDLTLELHTKNTVNYIQADPQRLIQVFDNLLNNTAKYAPGATVTITLMNDEVKLYASVEDDGPGIPSEYLDRLFERFYRVPESSTSARGSGLGLFICYHIIRAHGGEISVTSELGVGTRFNFYLPIHSSPLQTQEAQND